MADGRAIPGHGQDQTVGVGSLEAVDRDNEIIHGARNHGKEKADYHPNRR